MSGGGPRRALAAAGVRLTAGGSARLRRRRGATGSSIAGIEVGEALEDHDPRSASAPGAGGTEWFGTRTVVIPAARPARRPFSESSTTRHRRGLDAEPPGRLEEDVRRGLAVGDLVGRDDDPERVRQARRRERGVDHRADATTTRGRPASVAAIRRTASTAPSIAGAPSRR